MEYLWISMDTLYVRSTCTCELTLKRTTESDTTLSYLDVSISICQGNFITEVFDKRDNFNFTPICVVIYLLNLHMVCIFHSSLELVESVINLIVLLKALCQYISSNWLLYLTPDAVRCRVVDWRSVNIPDLSVAQLGGFAVGSVLGRTLAACGDGKSLCVRPVYVWALVCTQLNLHPVSGSAEYGFELCRMYGS